MRVFQGRPILVRVKTMTNAPRPGYMPVQPDSYLAPKVYQHPYFTHIPLQPRYTLSKNVWTSAITAFQGSATVRAFNFWGLHLIISARSVLFAVPSSWSFRYLGSFNATELNSQAAYLISKKELQLSRRDIPSLCETLFSWPDD